MSLEALYFISQIMAVILILGSLIFVGVEVRQNNRQNHQANQIAKADLSERSLSKFNDTWGIVATDDVVAEGFQKVLRDETDLLPGERVRLLVWFNNLLNSHFNAFLLVQDQLMDEKMLSAFDNNIAWCLSHTEFEREWERLLSSGLDFSPEYVRHVKDHRQNWHQATREPVEAETAPVETAESSSSDA